MAPPGAVPPPPVRPPAQKPSAPPAKDYTELRVRQPKADEDTISIDEFGNLTKKGQPDPKS
jgi:hypothetical protein